MTLRTGLILLAGVMLISNASGADFGTYSAGYKQTQKWRAMCDGPARYQAMSEAYEARKPNPCSSDKKFRR